MRAKMFWATVTRYLLEATHPAEPPRKTTVLVWMLKDGMAQPDTLTVKSKTSTRTAL